MSKVVSLDDIRFERELSRFPSEFSIEFKVGKIIGEGNEQVQEFDWTVMRPEGTEVLENDACSAQFALYLAMIIKSLVGDNKTGIETMVSIIETPQDPVINDEE